MIFDTRIAGIPCRCSVEYYSPHIPMRVYGTGMGDADPPEEEEFNFQILDRSGRRAEWLETKLTDDDRERLVEEYLTEVKAEDYASY